MANKKPECFGAYNKAFTGCGICKDGNRCKERQKKTGQRKISDHGVTPKMQDFIAKNPPNAIDPNVDKLNIKGNPVLMEFIKNNGTIDINSIMRELGTPEFAIPIHIPELDAIETAINTKTETISDELKNFESAIMPILFNFVGYSVLPKDVKVPKGLLDEFHKFMKSDKDNEDPPDKLVKLMRKFLGKKNESFSAEAFLFFLHKSLVNFKSTVRGLEKHKSAANMLTIFAYEGLKRIVLDLENKRIKESKKYQTIKFSDLIPISSTKKEVIKPKIKQKPKK